jgi:hypothetical protein
MKYWLGSFDECGKLSALVVLYALLIDGEVHH